MFKEIQMTRLFIALALVLVFSFVSVSAQTAPSATPTPVKPEAKSTPNFNASIPRERREEAYAKLFEGQRYIWSLSDPRSRGSVALGTKLAKESFLKAIELDPTLAEGYTALAELTYKSPPNDVNEAIRLAKKAVSLDKNNFGGHLVLARLYTHLSRLNRGTLDKPNAELAVSEWKEIARLDPRNAEAYAFLSEFYEELDQPAERISALKKWLSSATPLDQNFYRGIMGQADLSPEAALVKLGDALVKTGEYREAVEILSRAIGDNPNDDVAIELLSRAIESADPKTAASAEEALQQAIFANPDNVALITLLAEVRAGNGQIDEAAKIFSEAAARLSESNKFSAINLQLSLGDLYLSNDRINDAIVAYNHAFTFLKIENNKPVTDLDRQFSEVIFEKLIQTYKQADRPADVKKTIDRASLLFGSDDLFADKNLIDFYRENGQRTEALQAVRAARLKAPQSYDLYRQEAEILTESGKVDQGVALLRDVSKQNAAGAAGGNLVAVDDFTNQLVISSLYSQANRGRDAVISASAALAMAKGVERQQIAKVTLATALQMSGDHAGAERELREVLEISPNNPFALNNLGYFLLERDEKLEEALALIQKALEVSPGNPSFLDSLGWAYFKLKNYPEAEKHLKAAAKLDPASATILEHLGDVYQKLGKTDAAKQNWQRALKLSTDTVETARIKTKLGGKATK